MCTLPRDSYVLLVIAHPDDEAMFFSPLLVHCQQHEIPVFLICFSDGNFTGQGITRRTELIQSANILGIDRSRVTIVDNKYLQDGMDNNWSATLIAEVLLEYVQLKLKEDNILFNVIACFDHFGVSGHPNHIATYQGVVVAYDQLSQFYKNEKLIQYHNATVTATSSESQVRCLNSVSRDDVDSADEDDDDVVVYDGSPLISTFEDTCEGFLVIKLASVTLLRKYFGIFDIPLTYGLLFIRDNFLSCRNKPKFVFYNTFALQTFRAMKCHETQLLWYRYLFVLCSRYTYVNEFDLISFENCWGKRA